MGTSCVASSAIAVAPGNATSSDDAERIAFDLVETISTDFGLRPFDAGSERETHGLQECFSDRVRFVCGKILDREVQFHISEAGARRMSARADSLKRALLDGLRVQFGEANVRECQWKALGNKRVGCPPRAELLPGTAE